MAVAYTTCLNLSTACLQGTCLSTMQLYQITIITCLCATEYQQWALNCFMWRLHALSILAEDMMDKQIISTQVYKFWLKRMIDCVNCECTNTAAAAVANI